MLTYQISHSFATENNLGSHKKLCENKDWKIARWDLFKYLFFPFKTIGECMCECFCSMVIFLVSLFYYILRDTLIFPSSRFSSAFLKYISNFIGRSTVVGQHPMKSTSSVHLPVRHSVYPLLYFLKIGSLFFSDIVHDVS